MGIYERNLSNYEQAQRSYDNHEPDWDDSCENNGHDWELVSEDQNLWTYECTRCGERKKQ